MKQHMLNVDEAQIDKLKEQCRKNISKLSVEDVKDIEEAKKKNLSTRQEMEGCLEAISKASCEQIKNNQIEACNRLNQNNLN